MEFFGYLFEFVVFLLLVMPTSSQSNSLEELRKLCPNNDFCTVGRLSTKPDVHSCCLDCFCDDACAAYSDCCPDAEFAGIPPLSIRMAECTSNIVPNGYQQTDRKISTTFYRILGHCPRDYIGADGIAEKCEEAVYGLDRAYEDMVVVSGPGSVIYRNNYCALCHNVTDAVRWDLEVVACQSDLETVRLPASEMQAFIKGSCVLRSWPPSTVPFNSRMINCGVLVDTCRFGPDTPGVTNETVVGCQSGIYMPFHTNNRIMVFANPFCYGCNFLDDVFNEECNGIGIFVPRSGIKGSKGSFTKLLQGNTGSVPANVQSACAESKIMDHNSNDCVTLYCPPFEAASYGSCRPIASPTFMTLILLTFFWPIEDHYVSLPIREYNGTEKEIYAQRIQVRFGKLGCPEVSYYVYADVDPNSETLLQIMVRTQISIDNNMCTRDAISEIVRDQHFQHDDWLINDELMAMKGHESFFSDAEDLAPGAVRSLLMADPHGQLFTYELEKFMLCPYVELDLGSYNDLSLLGHNRNHSTLSELTARSETREGVYPLNPNLLAVCWETYLSMTGNQAGILLPSTNQVALVLLSSLVFAFLQTCMNQPLPPYSNV